MAYHGLLLGNPKPLEFLAVAHNALPFITVYPWSGSGFGTKYANPATLPTGTAGISVAFGAIYLT
jgi:hypothetical protein